MDDKKVVYISGPMSGIVNFNRFAFFHAAHKLKEKGYHILNPATLPDGLTQLQYMSICQPMVMAAEVIYMLPGWEDSAGARAEHELAMKLGLAFIYE